MAKKKSKRTLEDGDDSKDDKTTCPKCGHTFVPDETPNDESATRSRDNRAKFAALNRDAT